MESEIEKGKVHDRGNPYMLYVEIGKRLRIAHIELNYTQEQMAEILGISTAYYGKRVLYLMPHYVENDRIAVVCPSEEALPWLSRSLDDSSS